MTNYNSFSFDGGETGGIASIQLTLITVEIKQKKKNIYFSLFKMDLDTVDEGMLYNISTIC